MRRTGIVAVMLIALATPATAGELVLANGTRLTADLADLSVLVSTGADVVEVSPETIVVVTPSEVRLTDGRVLRGTLVGGRLRTLTAMGELAVRVEDLESFQAQELANAAAPALRSVEKGDMSFADDMKQVTARTEAEWTAFWRQHAATRPQPPVDFSREMEVGVFVGSRPTAGYGVEIVGTRVDQQALVVQFRESRPGRGAVAAQMVTSPYHLVAILTFDSAEAIQAALDSPEGKATAGDLNNFAQAGVELLTFDTKVV